MLDSVSISWVVFCIMPTLGSPADGTTIEITGTNLDVVGSTISTVSIGDSSCVVTTNTATSVVCEVFQSETLRKEQSLPPIFAIALRWSSWCL